MRSLGDHGRGSSDLDNLTIPGAKIEIQFESWVDYGKFRCTSGSQICRLVAIRRYPLFNGVVVTIIWGTHTNKWFCHDE